VSARQPGLVLACELPEGVTTQTLGVDGTERFELTLEAPLQHVSRRSSGSSVATAGKTRCGSRYKSIRRSRPPTSRQAESCPTSSGSCSPTRRARSRAHDSGQAHLRSTGAWRWPRILVGRLWPRGVKKEALAADAWMKVPTRAMRRTNRRPWLTRYRPSPSSSIACGRSEPPRQAQPAGTDRVRRLSAVRGSRRVPPQRYSGSSSYPRCGDRHRSAPRPDRRPLDGDPTSRLPGGQRRDGR